MLSRGPIVTFSLPGGNFALLLPSLTPLFSSCTT